MQKGLSKASVKAVIAACTCGVAASAWAVPQAVPFLSVDMNGGQLYTDVEGLGRVGQDNATNLGWNGTTNVPVLSPELGTSLSWQPWGGQDGILVPANPILATPAVNTGGDGIQLPHDAGYGGFQTLGNPISKGFAVPTGAVSSGNVTVNITAGSGLSLSSRDRNVGGGSVSLPADGTTNFSNMYRDFVYCIRDGGQGLGSDPVVIQLTGLNPNTTYEFTGFAFDPFSPGQHLWGAVAPQQFGYADNVGATTPDNFMDPPQLLRDSMVGTPITWQRDAADLTRSTPPATGYDKSTTFQVTADANGNVTFYEWANSYHDGGQSQTVFCGFQIGAVASSRWDATSSANWGTGPWTGGAPNSIGAVANLPQIGAPQTVTLESGKTVSVLTIASSNSYTIAGAALTLNGVSTNYTVLEGTPPPSPVVKTFNGHAQINVQGNHTISAPVVLNDNTLVRVAGGSSLTVSGAISGAGALNKLGNGVLAITGNSTTTGGITVFQGQLNLLGTHSGSGTFSVVGGGLLTGSGTVAGQANIWNGGAVSPGPDRATLTFTSLAFGSQNAAGGALTLNIDLAAGNLSDKLVVTSGLGFAQNPDTLATWDGSVVLNFNNNGAGVGSTFTVIDYEGTTLADVDNFVPAVPLLGDLQPQIINNTVNKSVDMTLAVPNEWNLNNDGNSSVNENWSANASPNGVGQVAKFGTIITGPHTVTLDVNTTLGGIAFSSPNAYTIGGNTLTMDVTAGSPVLNVTQGNHTISAPVSLSDNIIITVTPVGSTLVLSGAVSKDANLPTATVVGLTKAGAGTASLTGVNTYNGPSTVQAGALKMNEAASDRVFNGGGAVVNGGRLVLDYTGASPANAVKALLDAGYDQATKFSTGPIRTTNPTGGLIGLGWRESVANTEVIVAYTYYGDSDLNGQVDVNDLGNLATSWQSSGVWATGDFDYNNTIDVNDLGLLATNWQAGVGNPLGPDFASALASFGLPSVSVPEPATIGLLSLMPLALKRRGGRSRGPRQS